MKRFIVGLLVGLLSLAQVALAGPVEKRFYEQGYTKAVYDIFVDHMTVNGPITMYGEGLAIGPTHILTGRHVIDNYVISDGRELTTQVISIRVALKKKNPITRRLKMCRAKVVVMGDTTEHADDWAIIELVEGELQYWIAAKLAVAVPGEDVYNVAGNGTLYAGVIPMIILHADPEGLVAGDDDSEDSYVVKDLKTKKLELYIATPRARGGDSGTPVFNENGELIGVLVAGNERYTLLVKAEKFKKHYKKYQGR